MERESNGRPKWEKGGQRGGQLTGDQSKRTLVQGSLRQMVTSEAQTFPFPVLRDWGAADPGHESGVLKTPQVLGGGDQSYIGGGLGL